MRPIPLVDVKAQYVPFLPRIREAIDGVLESGEFILGPNVAAFEREAADYLGVRDSVGVANGTDALVLVLDALGVGRGDEVICPAFTFYATAEAIARRGATPVFADVDASTMNLEAEDVAARITKRTKAILAVHLFGRPAPLAELVQLGVPVIEDVAEAFGSPVPARIVRPERRTVTPWKRTIAKRGLARPRPGRGTAIAFAVLIVTSIAAAMIHVTGIVRSVGTFSPLGIHVATAVAAIAVGVAMGFGGFLGSSTGALPTVRPSNST